MKFNKKIKGYITTVMTATSLALPELMVYAQGAGDVEAKLKSAGTTIQGVLTGLLIIVAIVVSLYIILTRMPSANNPQEKDLVYQALGRVIGLVAIGAAIVWILPWVYSLFT